MIAIGLSLCCYLHYLSDRQQKIIYHKKRWALPTLEVIKTDFYKEQ